MRKHEIKICKCGRIHAIKNEKLNTVFKENKNLLLICGGCGLASLIGADTEPDYIHPEKEVYMMYTSDFSTTDEIIDVSSFESDDHKKGIYEIFYSQGYKVPMMTGMYATDYFCGHFSDRWYPDFYHIQRKDITVKEIMEFIEKYNHDRTTVNMQRFINETPNEILEDVSCYLIDGFNWKDTIYEKEWDK